MSVDAAAYDPILGTLSINATVWEYMELVADYAPPCCGSVEAMSYLASVVGSPIFRPHINVARARHWFREVKGFP